MEWSWKTQELLYLPRNCEAVLKLIHEGPLGWNMCKLHAKGTVYLPELNNQLEKMLLHCVLCLKYSQSKHKQKPTMSLGQAFHYTLGPSWPQICFILRVHNIYWLWTIQVDFQWYVSYLPWLDNMLQTSARRYFLNMVGQEL